MSINYVLIDFESVQPASFLALTDDHIKVLVFVGAKQGKLPFDVVVSLQRLGSRAEYLMISGSGPNALDFHIAYYIGRLAVKEPSAQFCIVSKDTGFDPLIQHLNSRKITARRVTTVADIRLPKTLSATRPAAASNAKPAANTSNPKPVAKPSKSKPAAKASNGQPLPERITHVITRLKQYKTAKPRTDKTLRSSIASFFPKKLSEQEIESIVQSLVARGWIKITGTKVTYSLPGDA